MITVTNLSDNMNDLKMALDEAKSLAGKENRNKRNFKDYLDKIKFDFVYNNLISSGFDMKEKDAFLFIKKGNLSDKYSLSEYLLLKNYYQLIEYLFEKDLNNIELSSEVVIELHSFLTRSITEIKSNNGTKNKIIPVASGEFINEKANTELNNLIDWFSENPDKLHFVEKIIIFYVKFLLIKPFAYGNSIIAFIILNLFLIKFGLAPVAIYPESFDDYYKTLLIAKNGKYKDITNFFVKIIGENVKHCVEYINGKEIHNTGELKRRIEEFNNHLRSLSEPVFVPDKGKDTEYEKSIEDVDIIKNLKEIYAYLDTLCKDLFVNRGDNDFSWEIHSPVRIDNFPIANSAVIVEKFEDENINISNTLVGPTYLDFVNEGSGIYIKIKPGKRYIPKASLAFCVLTSYKSLYLVGSTSVAHIEQGEEKLVPNEKSKVYYLEGSFEFSKWSNEKIEEFMVKCVDSFLTLVEEEVEGRKKSFDMI